MTTDAPSLNSLLPALMQSELFDPQALPAGLELLVPVEEQRKRFTAERVAQNRDRYLAIVGALAEELPVRMICRAFSVSHHVVKRIRETEPELVATEKQRLAKLYGHAGRMSVERFLEMLESGSVPANVLPVAAAIFHDKRALIDGEATSRVEHIHAMPSVEDLAREIEAIVTTPETNSDQIPEKTQ